MKQRTTTRATITALITVISASIMFGATQPTTPPKEPTKQPEKKIIAEVGEAAPAFTLKDQNEKTHSLSDYKGKIVVLEWFSESCPYCRKTWESGQVTNLIKTLDGLQEDVVYIAMNSTANRPEEDIVKGGKEFLEELDATTALLFDYTGEVGRAYGARTTPHMFVIDSEGVLVFQGAFSDDKRFKKGNEAEIYVLTAVNQLIVGEKVSPSYVQPWGCGIKYAGKDNGRGGRGGRPNGRPGF
jgi:peroxiredoxin